MKDMDKSIKSGAQDEREGKFQQVKGSVKETAGKVFGDRKLENRGKAEKNSGKVQEKVGQVKRVLGK